MDNMTSTELKIGLTSSARPSSRVLKPPGGGHSNIFAEPEVSVNAPRPKYNQQNSSNLNACMGSTDANVAVEKLREEVCHKKEDDNNMTNAAKAEKSDSKSNSSNGIGGGNNDANANTATKTRVPPGGHSSGGFW
ncbi:uncharacterized protein LOC111687682 [Lucilia cuprina]|uniref:uncharacterized protein LOC111687682 n=1 Tax=Lucilia cuprina TaxID=7375 RepID=UPI001F06CEBA|nr:uncharacterized protein LOC111687682 [Lucilia cuprina]XP_023305915.2 uncharacterized protein LOC111687682 [Lucilia cuprina]XP_046806130.1 uncharacterized protein LOC111687682 [Lucilia cuprina]